MIPLKEKRHSKSFRAISFRATGKIIHKGDHEEFNTIEEIFKNLPEKEQKKIKKRIEDLFKNTVTLMLIGEGAVGKSSITRRYIDGNFVFGKYDPTVGDFEMKSIELFGISCNVDIFDSAGQEEYKSFIDSNIHKVDIIVYVVSPESKHSITRAKKDLKKYRKNPSLKPFVLQVLVMNKMDLVKKVHLENRKEINKLSSEFGVPLYKMSALHNINVHVHIDDIIRRWAMQAEPKKSDSEMVKSKCIMQ